MVDEDATEPTVLPDFEAGNACDAAISCLECTDSDCLVRCTAELTDSDLEASQPMLGCVVDTCTDENGMLDAACAMNSLEVECAQHLDFCDAAQTELNDAVQPIQPTEQTDGLLN